MLSDAQCRPVAEKLGGTTCADIPWHWLGTDNTTRDVLARVIYGFRISVLFGLILAAISSVIGVVAGAVQGYFGGWVDLAFQRFIEVWGGIPTLYLIIIISAFIAPGFFVLLGIMLLFSWVSLVSVVRAEFLRARNFEYVRAARALGLSNIRIMAVHLLPNAMVATLTFLPFILNGSITTLTSLDFLGFGLPPGSPSLGELLAQGKDNLTGAVARADRLPGHRRDAEPAGLRRRGGARRVRPAQDLRLTGTWRFSGPRTRRRNRPTRRGVRRSSRNFA